MDYNTGRPNNIMDWLVRLHDGTWFEFEGEHIYENLIILDEQYTKPTEEECNAGLAQMQADFDAQQYQRNRQAAYPSIGDQLDMIFKSGVLDGSDWAAAIQAVKDAHPKPDAE